MTKIKCLLGLMTILVFCGDLSAQEFGRGRFLKRLRDEIVGNKKDQDDKKTPKAQADGRTPTPADPRSRPAQQNDATSRNQAQRGRTPTRPTQAQLKQQALLQQQAYLKQQALLQKQRAQLQANRAPQAPSPENLRSLLQSQQSRALAKPNGPSSSTQPTPPSRSITRQVSSRKNLSRKGFGMEVVAQKGNLVVSRVDPQGNAAEAEIRPGDIIIEVGGLEVETVNEFEEFTKILGEGDQMEFKINSRGKKRSVNITHGVVPDLESQSAVSFTPPQDSNDDFVASRNTNSGRLSVMERTNGIEDTAKTARPQTDVRNTSLQRTITNQQREIEALRAEIVRLRQQVVINQKNEGTSLNGPGN